MVRLHSFSMNTFLKDIRATMVLGVPLIIAQLCTMAMAMTDAIMVGRGVGTEALAAMAFGLNFMNVPCIALFGISSATSVYIARAFGSGKFDELPAVLRHGIFLSFCSSVAVVGAMCWLFDHLQLLGYLGQPPELIPIARPYMHLYAVAFVFMLCGGNCRAYCESQNRPWLPLYVIMGSIALNAFLCYGLVYGVCGLPRMGLEGAGLATLICSVGQFFALVYIILHNNLHLSLSHLLHPHITRFYVARHLRLGIPTALQICVEVASMSIMALFAGRLGAETLAAHHVTMQVVMFLFMVPQGMSFAVSIRVSQASGANDRARVKSVCTSAMTFAIGWMLATALLMLSLHGQIPKLFTHDTKVIELSGGFLIIAGLFQVFDGMQCTAMGALRGLKDVNRPTIAVMLFYWVMEIPLAWFLCFTCHMGGTGIWLSMLFGLILSATFLTMRLKRVSETKALMD